MDLRDSERPGLREGSQVAPAGRRADHVKRVSRAEKRKWLTEV